MNRLHVIDSHFQGGRKLTSRLSTYTVVIGQQSGIGLKEVSLEDVYTKNRNMYTEKVILQLTLW